ncbi:MAG: sporulation protein [Acidimicrobiia bacterium]|nr:sporulation protein [Acidimicrobiia bacterium]
MPESTPFTPQGIHRLVAEAKDLMTVRQVVGEPIERDGATLVPVVEVRGGGGGGGGGGSNGGEDTGSGEGMGFAMRARPVGSYVMSDGKVRWEPAIDVTKIAVFGNVAALVLFLAIWKSRRSSQ